MYVYDIRGERGSKVRELLVGVANSHQYSTRSARWRLVLGGVGLVCAGAVAGGLVTSAAAETTRSTGESQQFSSVDPRLAENQDKLDAIAISIQDVENPDDGSAPTSSDIAGGFSGVVADPASLTLRLYWVGDVPARVRSILAAADPSVKVMVIPATYTLSEEEAAANRLMKATHLRLDGAMIDEVGASHDGNGIVVQLYSTTGINLKSVARDATSIAGMTALLDAHPLGARMPAGTRG